MLACIHRGSIVLINFDVVLNIASFPIALEGLPKFAWGFVADWLNLNIPFNMVVIRRGHHLVDFSLEKWPTLDWVFITIERRRLHVKSLGIES